MSSLWTPGGERPVAREPESPADEQQPVDEAELQARMAELREQLAHTPVEGIVAQMAYQLFEIGALHLSVQPPQFGQAQLAIDALAQLVEGMGERLGEHAGPLRDGLSQIRMAFVQIKEQAQQGRPEAEPEPTGERVPPPPTGPGGQAPPQS